MIFRLKTEVAPLVNDMLNKLPDNAWADPTFTFLDPAMGGGQFVSEVEKRLKVKGHSDANIKKRVFGVEKNELYVKYAVNKNKLVGTYVVDKKDVPDIYRGMKFDAIVGNPPYQNGNSENMGSSGKLWMDFVEASIEQLKPDGYLCIVHPIGWRTLNNWMWEKIYQKKQVIYTRIQPKIEWNVGVNVDWYVLQNRPYMKATEVEFDNETKKIDFRTVSGIINDSVVEKLLKYSGDKIDFKQVSQFHTQYKEYSEEKNGKYKFQARHTTPKNVLYFTEEHKWQSKKKVLVSNSGYLYPTYDGGKLGTTQACWAAFVNSKSEGEYLIKLLNSKLFDYFITSVKTSGYNNKLLRLLPYPSGLSPSFTDADLYAHFNLTKDEIKKIEDSSK